MARVPRRRISRRRWLSQRVVIASGLLPRKLPHRQWVLHQRQAISLRVRRVLGVRHPRRSIPGAGRRGSRCPAGGASRRGHVLRHPVRAGAHGGLAAPAFNQRNPLTDVLTPAERWHSRVDACCQPPPQPDALRVGCPRRRRVKRLRRPVFGGAHYAGINVARLQRTIKYQKNDCVRINYDFT